MRARVSAARYSNIAPQLQNRQTLPKTGLCICKKKEMQMEQHVGLILSIILHLCASSKHNRVKRTCSARTLAFKTKASYLHMRQCSKEFIHFPEMEQSGKK